jgi:formylglycine-generating enzyme required for sulfatase activity
LLFKASQEARVAGHSIFIGYRRDDTADVSGRVYDRLRGTFGPEAVFKDVDNLDPGVEFGEYILGVLPKCRVFLAMIGPGWVDVRNETGARRLNDPKDWVRIELETALTTPGLQVVPVLVNGAPMPRIDDLPETLRRLPALNAALVRRDPDFHKDMDKLIRALEAGVASGRVEVEVPQAALAGSAAAWKLIADSMDVHDYTDFQTHFPGTPEVILAGRQKRQLEAWAQVSRSDSDAISAFLQAGAFPALERIARDAMSSAAEAKQRAFERVIEERRAREAAEAEARRKAEEEARARIAARSRPGAVWRDAIPGLSESACPEMVTIPPGKFVMGSPSSEERWSGDDGREEPQHEVRIDYAFALGKHELTVDEFAAFIAETKHDTGASAYIWNGKRWEDTSGKGWRDPGFVQSGRHPVCCVNWNDAKAYVAWLNSKLGLEGRRDAYRLPSEAEWEYACRAGTTTPFSFGATISTAQANYNGEFTYGAGKKGEYRQKTTPVGSFPANAFGLHDMHGNVWEWCEDVWHASYNGAPTDGSARPAGGDSSSRVLRGGSWGLIPQFLRSAYRGWNYPTGRSGGRGFRLARTV